MRIVKAVLAIDRAVWSDLKHRNLLLGAFILGFAYIHAISLWSQYTGATPPLMAWSPIGGVAIGCTMLFPEYVQQISKRFRRRD